MMKTVLTALFLLLFSAAIALAAVLNLNTATAGQLEALPGIGATKAQAIVTYREQHGPFKSVNDLTHVKGIGAKTLAHLRDSLTVDE